MAHRPLQLQCLEDATLQPIPNIRPWHRPLSTYHIKFPRRRKSRPLNSFLRCCCLIWCPVFDAITEFFNVHLLGYFYEVLSFEMRDWPRGGGRRWWRQELHIDWVMCLNYFKHSEGTVSDVCRILSTRKPSRPFQKSPGVSHPGNFWNRPCRDSRHITLALLPWEKKSNASMSRLNNFGISQKYYKPSMLRSTKQPPATLSHSITVNAYSALLAIYALTKDDTLSLSPVIKKNQMLSVS